MAAYPQERAYNPHPQQRGGVIGWNASNRTAIHLCAGGEENLREVGLIKLQLNNRCRPKRLYIACVAGKVLCVFVRGVLGIHQLYDLKVTCYYCVTPDSACPPIAEKISILHYICGLELY